MGKQLPDWGGNNILPDMLRPGEFTGYAIGCLNRSGFLYRLHHQFVLSVSIYVNKF